MALISCKDCGAEISKTARTCPKCGAKQPRRVGWVGMVVAAVLLYSIVRCSYDQNIKAESPPAAPKTPEQQQQEQAEAAERAKRAKEEASAFAWDMARVVSLKGAMKNPASFELVEAGRMENGTLCLTHRATNGFNAIVTDRTAILSTGKMGAWNKDCGGKSGADITSKIKAGLKRAE